MNLMIVWTGSKKSGSKFVTLKTVNISTVQRKGVSSPVGKRFAMITAMSLLVRFGTKKMETGLVRSVPKMRLRCQTLDSKTSKK